MKFFNTLLNCEHGHPLRGSYDTFKIHLSRLQCKTTRINNAGKSQIKKNGFIAVKSHPIYISSSTLWFRLVFDTWINGREVLDVLDIYYDNGRLQCFKNTAAVNFYETLLFIFSLKPLSKNSPMSLLDDRF